MCGSKAAVAVVSESISHCHHYSHHNQRNSLGGNDRKHCQPQIVFQLFNIFCLSTVTFSDMILGWLVWRCLMDRMEWNGICMIMVCARQHNLMAIFSDWKWVCGPLLFHKVIYGDSKKRKKIIVIIIFQNYYCCCSLHECVLWSILVFFYDYWLLERS